MTNLFRGTWLTVVIGGLCPLIAVAQQSIPTPQIATPQSPTPQTVPAQVATPQVPLPQGETVTPARGGQRGRLSQSERATMPAPQGFSVVLVLGEMQGTGAAENVPPAARKALADMKDFLPYKTYRLLDTQWTLCCGRSAIATRLRGDEQDYYDLELEPNRTETSGKWYVRFSLRNAPAGGSLAAAQPATDDNRMAILTQQRAEVEAQIRNLKQRYNDNHPEVQKARAQLAEIERQQAQLRADTTRRRAMVRPVNRTVIDTSFTMDIGETVVVGTSRLQGDKALIALLTAVASTKPASTTR
jgi:hypothetical protein